MTLYGGRFVCGVAQTPIAVQLKHFNLRLNIHNRACVYYRTMSQLFISTTMHVYEIKHILLASFILEWRTGG